MKIAIKNLDKSFGKDKIFNNFNLEITDEKINCIIGQSGCGKSTLLNMISGLEKYDKGNISGADIKDISYIFQEERLIEHLTVYDNLKIALKKYYDKNLIDKEIYELLNIVGIETIKDKYPYSLSGGMKQRVNIARAFGKPSKIILMDEPFKSLDYKLKYSIIDEFIEILKQKHRMVIMVTHDLDEALYFNGNIYVFGGRPVKINGKFDNNLNENKNKIISVM